MKVFYTLDSFINDILTQIKMVNRVEVCHIRLMRILLDVLKSTDGIPTKGTNEELELLRSVVRKKINDDNLFAYASYVSSRENFNYTRTYMLGQIKSYEEFLIQSCRFITSMIRDINQLITVIITSKKGVADLKLMFMDIFCVSLIGTHPFAKTEVDWDKFQKITEVRVGYYISVKRGNATLLTKFYKFGEDITTLINDSIELFF